MLVADHLWIDPSNKQYSSQWMNIFCIKTPNSLPYNGANNTTSTSKTFEIVDLEI